MTSAGRTDPAQVQLMVTGIREALAAGPPATVRSSGPRIRRAADVSLLTEADARTTTQQQ